MKLVCLLAVAAATLSGAGYGLFVRDVHGGSASPPAAPVVAPVRANGKTEGARQEVPLRPNVSGTIKAIHVRANQEVKQGDVLVELRCETQQQEVELARAEVALARSQALQAKSESDRSQRLASGVVAQEKKEADRFHHLQAQARVDQAEARLRLAQATLAEARIVAPWSGRVLRVFAEAGALAGPTSTNPVLILADVSKRRVRASVEELDALRVKSGQRAVITVDALPGKEFTGHVSDEVLLRMDNDAPQSDAPGEYKDIYFRPVVIELDAGHELPLNYRVLVHIYTD